jgi:hypothetical protein
MSTVAAPKKTYELIAIAFLIPALYIQLKWLQVFMSSGTLSAEARTSTFVDSFPIVSSARVIALISLAFSVLAIVYASRSFNQPKTFLRVSSFVVVFIGSITALLSIFEML